jgi:hypothetical protein
MVKLSKEEAFCPSLEVFGAVTAVDGTIDPQHGGNDYCTTARASGSSQKGRDCGKTTEMVCF